MVSRISITMSSGCTHMGGTRQLKMSCKAGKCLLKSMFTGKMTFKFTSKWVKPLLDGIPW